MELPKKILVVDDELSMREMISILLERNGFEVETASSGQEVSKILDSKKTFDLVVTDLLMDHGGGLEVLTEIKKRLPNCDVILVTAFGTAETAVEAMKKGAFDYVTKPFNVDEFMIIVHQALERQALIRENIDLRARVRGRYKFADLVGRSQAMRGVIDLCRKVADSSATVLISGESGTGKEVVARALHFSGPRADKPFVAVNCGALPEQLMESELFGHAKGSFTGANEDKVGLFRAAHEGTVFLDEIGELPQPLQVKMLRVLQDRTVRPVGHSEETSVDIRVIAATNQILSDQVKSGEFRTDLYYRLNVIHIKIPPLRDRKEDIPILTEQLLRRISSEQNTSYRSCSPDVMKALMRYNYPGNVRELSNILERALTLTSSSVIGVDDLPDPFSSSAAPGPIYATNLPPDGLNLDAAIADLERNLIEQALERASFVKTKAASLLGISFRSFRYRLDKLGIDAEDGSSE